MAKVDEELLQEVTYLVEYPTALVGHFEEKYLQIPEELVVTPMREHQRYFPVYDAQGHLLPRFITVRNGDARNLATVAAGNENVLRARLAGAEFFYREDLKDNMEDKVEALSQVVFHEKLGTMRQKVGRVVKIASYLAHELGYSEQEIEQTERAAYLAKADLGSRAVYEFPELQGIMGEYYALAAGEDPVVAQAIREHYLPRFAGDALPVSKPGIAVALADKLDSLCGFFAIGMVPSGSQDPYALRRAAAGCAQIIIKHKLKLPLQKLQAYIISIINADVGPLDMVSLQPRLDNINTFLRQRLENILSEEGISYDVINAIASAVGGDLFGAVNKAYALQRYREDERFLPLLQGFHRVANILRAAKDKGLLPEEGLVRQELLNDPAEKALYQDLQRVCQEVAQALAAEDYLRVLQIASGLAQSINDFFAQVMVMADDADLRNNRLALLKQIRALTAPVGDLNEIVEK